MNNLNANITELVVTVCMLPFLVAALWAVLYFGARIILFWWIHRQLGDMPSAEEIQKLYAENNEQIINPYHWK